MLFDTLSVSEIKFLLKGGFSCDELLLSMRDVDVYDIGRKNEVSVDVLL